MRAWSARGGVYLCSPGAVICVLSGPIWPGGPASERNQHPSSIGCLSRRRRHHTGAPPPPPSRPSAGSHLARQAPLLPQRHVRGALRRDPHRAPRLDSRPLGLWPHRRRIQVSLHFTYKSPIHFIFIN